MCGRGAFRRSEPFLVEQDTRCIDALRRRLTRWGAAATSLSFILSSEINNLDTSSSCTQTPKRRCETFHNTLKNSNTRVPYRFSSLFLKSNACFQIYDNASPWTEPQWRLAMKLPIPLAPCGETSRYTAISYSDYVTTLTIY